MIKKASFSKKRYGPRVALAGGMCAAALAVFAGTAYAPPSSCSPGYMCVWTGGNFGGQQWSVANGHGYANAPAWMHDQGSSWANHTGRRWCVYDNSGSTVLDYVNINENVGTVPLGTNDRIDSVGPC